MYSEKTGPSLSLNFLSLTTFRKLKKRFLELIKNNKAIEFGGLPRN